MIKIIKECQYCYEQGLVHKYVNTFFALSFPYWCLKDHKFFLKNDKAESRDFPFRILKQCDVFSEALGIID